MPVRDLPEPPADFAGDRRTPAFIALDAKALESLPTSTRAAAKRGP